MKKYFLVLLPLLFIGCHSYRNAITTNNYSDALKYTSAAYKDKMNTLYYEKTAFSKKYKLGNFRSEADEDFYNDYLELVKKEEKMLADIQKEKLEVLNKLYY